MRARFKFCALRLCWLAPVVFFAVLHGGPARAQGPDCTIVASDISADPESIVLGGSTTLYWSFDGPNECPVLINGVAVTQYGNRVEQPRTTTPFVLTTKTTGGADFELDRVTVQVTGDCALTTTGTLSALPRTIHAGEKSKLTWSVAFPRFCHSELRINDQVVTGASGSINVQPGATTEYRLTTAFQPGQPHQLASAVVAVNARTVIIRGNGTFWKDLLVKSLGEDGTTVVLAETVDMDLTGRGPIYIRESVTLTGRSPPRFGRTAQRLGPRLFTRDRPRPLLYIRCNSDDTILGNNVRLSHFRLHGPHYGTMSGDENLENGIRVTSCVNVEIANMEVAGWSGQAIYVGEEANRGRIHKSADVHIHDNYIHHNQHKGGNGYGVNISAGADALIERNVFDFNRHAIAASGKIATSYTARDNLVLKGGGVHGRIYNHFTHQFDVHGDKNCGPSSSIWNCGNAGTRFIYSDNSFQYTNDYALKLRGVPRLGAFISGNVFAHRELDDAVETYNDTRIYYGRNASRNLTNYDSYGQYGVCDFDGDGKDDLFLATGKTWWYASTAKMHWVYLKAAMERLHQVGLGDFNDDGRCDVLAASSGDKWAISPGGSGAWTMLPGIYPVPFTELRFADFNADGRTDVFRRATNGQWSVVSPGVHGWRNLASSSFPLSELQFGDFTGDGRADVVSRNGGRWSISRSGTGPWTRINPSLNTDLKTVKLADVDGNGTDDVVRFTIVASPPTHPRKGTWEVSWGGRTPWRTVKTLTVAAPGPNSVVGLRTYAGNFNGSVGDDLLLVDYVRQGRLYSHPARSFVLHNLFAY